jgi:4-amino-4-deoxychorismate lyase
MSRQVLALLNQPSLEAEPHAPGAAPFTLVDARQPHLSVLDLGVTRGDGVFESLSVSGGVVHGLDAHLARFVSSAARLDLPAPDVATWRAAILAVVAELAQSDQGLASFGQALVKAVLTRGVEGDGRPTGWVLALPAADHRAAREGVRVVTLDRGYRHDVAETSPWLLVGAKTLSYAANAAILREAARRGADDAILVSSDGYVLEGTTSSVVLQTGSTLVTPGSGGLAGTTQARVFEWAAGEGYATRIGLVTVAELAAADSVWLVSSVRLAAPVRELDGRAVVVDADLTAQLNVFLLN